GLKEGDHIPVYTQRGQQNFTVRGFFKTTGASVVFGGNIALMDIHAAQQAFDHVGKFDRIDVMTAPSANIDAVQQTLRARLPAALEITKPDRRGEGLEKAVSAMHLSLLIMSLLAVTVGVFIIFNSMSVSVNQRSKEIGVLRSIGVEAGRIQKMFLVEAVVLGMVGSALGVGLGFVLAAGATRIMSGVSASIYGLVSTPEPFAFRWDFAVTALAIGVACSLIAAWVPARAASHLNPIQALHNIEVQRSEGVLGWTRFAVGLLFIVVG